MTESSEEHRADLTQLELGELVCQSYRGGSWIKHVALLGYGCHRSWYAVQAFERVQRKRVARFGECGTGCNGSNLVPRLSGRVICKLTNQPCPKQQLSGIAERIGTINGSRAVC